MVDLLFWVIDNESKKTSFIYRLGEVMTTTKGIFNTIVGVIMTIVISILQLTFLYVTGLAYGEKINGLIRVIISFLTYLSLTEGGLGLITIFSLYRPLQNDDYETVNDIINTTRKTYHHSGKIYLIILVSAGFILGLASANLPVIGLDMGIAFWQVALIIIALGSRELIFFYFSGAYQNLIQADQKGYLNRLIFIFSEIIMYILLMTLLVIRKADGKPIDMYIPFFAYFVCGVLKAFVTFIVVKIEYPWLQHKKWTQQKRMLKQSWWVVLNRLPDMIVSNIDIILITLFLSLTTTSIYTIYLIIVTTMRAIALILISSFREVFGYWIAKSGRIRWTVYTKFELYAYMIAGFLFINQFIITQYLVSALSIPANVRHIDSSFNSSKNLFINLFLSQPWFILLLSLKNTIQVATEPGKVIVNATVKHKETIWGSYIQAIINLLLGIILGWILSSFGWKYQSYQYLALSLYMIILSSCIGWIYRLIVIWIYVWKHLTYNSDLRFIIQNTLVLIIPILTVTLFGCLYFFDKYPPTYDFKNYSFVLRIIGYSLLYSAILILGLAMTINFHQFWSIFNFKKVFSSLFSRKQKQKAFINQEVQEFFKDSNKSKTAFTNKTFDWTATYQSTNMNVDDFIEEELLRRKKEETEIKSETKDFAKSRVRVGIYKIRG